MPSDCPNQTNRCWLSSGRGQPDQLDFDRRHPGASGLIRFLRPLVCALFLITAGPLWAQAPQTASDRLDGVRATLDQIEQTLTRKDLTDTELSDLRSRTEPSARLIQTVIDGETPKVAAAKVRLDQLGPRPGDKDPAEPPQVSSERDLIQ